MTKIIDIVIAVLRKVLPEGYMTKITGVASLLAALVMIALRVTGSDIIDPGLLTTENIAGILVAGLGLIGLGDKVDRLT